jgi:hypothetical protein
VLFEVPLPEPVPAPLIVPDAPLVPVLLDAPLPAPLSPNVPLAAKPVSELPLAPPPALPLAALPLLPEELVLGPPELHANAAAAVSPPNP